MKKTKPHLTSRFVTSASLVATLLGMFGVPTQASEPQREQQVPSNRFIQGSISISNYEGDITRTRPTITLIDVANGTQVPATISLNQGIFSWQISVPIGKYKVKYFFDSSDRIGLTGPTQSGVAKSVNAIRGTGAAESVSNCLVTRYHFNSTTLAAADIVDTALSNITMLPQAILDCNPPSVIISQSLSKRRAYPGDLLSYNIVLSNVSTRTVTVNTITQTLAADVSYQNNSTTGAITSNPVINAETLVWKRPVELAAGKSATVTFAVSVLASAEPKISVNGVEAQAVDQVSGASVNTKPDNVALTKVFPAILLNIVPNVSSAQRGDTVTWTIGMNSDAPSLITVDKLNDVLPDELSYIPGSTSGATTSNPTIANNELTWGPFTIAPGLSKTLSFSTKVLATAAFTNVFGNINADASIPGTNITPNSTGYALRIKPPSFTSATIISTETGVSLDTYGHTNIAIFRNVTTSVTINSNITCPNPPGGAPDNVRLLSGDTYIPMTLLNSNRYSGTVMQAQLQAGNLQIVATCNGQILPDTVADIWSINSVYGKITGGENQSVPAGKVALYRAPGLLPDYKDLYSGQTIRRDCRMSDSISVDEFISPPNISQGVLVNPNYSSGEKALEPPTNPQSTTKDGRFGWNIPDEGCYFIVASAPGYRPRVSPILGNPMIFSDFDLYLLPDTTVEPQITNTPTRTPTATATSISTNTPTAAATSISTNTPTAAATSISTRIPTATPTRTPVVIGPTRIPTMVATLMPTPQAVRTLLSPARVYANYGKVAINAFGAAAPAPSKIRVSGATGMVGNVSVQLNGLTHSRPNDLDIVLVSPNGTKVMLMSDAGGSKPVWFTGLAFRDSATQALPESTQIFSGIYKPTNYGNGDVLGTLAGPFANRLSAFNGTPANGTWSLYVWDDTAQNYGALNLGWSLIINTTCCSTTPHEASTAD